MCQYKSAIVLRDLKEKGGFKLLMSPWTESHSELEIMFKLRDGSRLNWAKVEYSPDEMKNAHLIEKYRLIIDEERTPDWFDDEMKEKVQSKMESYVKSIIVTGDVQLLIGGQFIIAPRAKVECAKAMVINVICGGTVSEICGGTVSAIWGGTVSAIRGGTVSAICGGTVSEIWGGTVSEICGGTVSAIRGGTVSEICGGTVSAIRGGTVSAIRKHFDGIIGKISSAAKILSDDRKK